MAASFVLDGLPFAEAQVYAAIQNLAVRERDNSVPLNQRRVSIQYDQFNSAVSMTITLPVYLAAGGEQMTFVVVEVIP